MKYAPLGDVGKLRSSYLATKIDDVVMGCILRDTLGPTAKKLIAKRCIDALDGTVGSYSRLLNSSARLEQIK